MEWPGRDPNHKGVDVGLHIKMPVHGTPMEVGAAPDLIRGPGMTTRASVADSNFLLTLATLE